MALKPNDPDCIEIETLAKLMVQAADADWSLIRRSHPARARHRRDGDVESSPVSREHLAKVRPVPLVLQQPAGATGTGTASVARSADAARPLSGGKRILRLSRSQAWATTQLRQGRQGAPRGRGALAAGVAIVFIALSVNMLNHSGVQSARTVPVAAKSAARVAPWKNARPDELALAAPPAPIAAPAAPVTAAVEPVAAKSAARVAPRKQARPDELALAAPPDPIAVPAGPVTAAVAPVAVSSSAPVAVLDPAPRAEASRTEASRTIATIPGRAEPSDPDAEPAHKVQRSVDQHAEQLTMQSQSSQPSDQAGGASQHLEKRHENVAQPDSRVTAQSRHATETGYPLVASSPVHEPRPGARSTRELPSVPQRLLLARAALVNRDQRAARGLMEEAQTLITFQPANAAPRLSVVTASQLTEALIRLGRGDDAGALQRLNQLIEAIRQTS